MNVALQEVFFLLLIFLFGLAVGSFLNVVILRLYSKRSIWWARSECTSCKHKLGARELIPLVSFLFLAGRCRFCDKEISLQYPLVELGTGLLFVLVASKFWGAWYDLTFWLFFAASFIILFTFDIKQKRIPGEIVWPLVVGAILYIGMPLANYSSIGTRTVLEHLQSAFATGGFITLVVLLTREKGMGRGDIPVAFLQGLLLGIPKGLYALGLSFIIGAVVGVALLITKRAHLKSAVPFAPFLILGLFAILFST